MLCLVPALRSLRSALPDAHVTLVGLPGARWMLERFPRYLDDFLEFPGFPGIPEVPADSRRLTEFLASVQGRFDLALQMHGSGSNSNAFTLLLGARITAGFYLPALWCPSPAHFAPYPAHLHEVRRWLALMEFLGLPAGIEELEFPVQPADREGLRAAWPGNRSGYVCLHPGAHEAPRRWPVECFASLGNALADEGMTVVLTGTAAEREITSSVARAMRRDSVDLAGRTDLGTLAALMQGAALVVCNDTGVSHLAAALKTPSVVIFAASDPGRWAPLDGELHRALGRINPENINACRHTPEIKGHRCLRDACSSLITVPEVDWAPAEVEEVLRQARELLAASSAH
jgi:ADP-heptose:LPS heptosyltransferase